MSEVAILAPTKIELIDLSKVDDNPDNVRNEIGYISDLAASIKSRGLMNPITVAAVDGRYQIIAGHRRVAALREIGVRSVPATLRAQEGDVEMVVDMLIENLHREGLTPMEEGRAFTRLKELGKKQRDIATLVGCSQPHVSKRMSLTDLPIQVQEAIDAGGINVNDAVSLLDLKDDPDTLIRVFNNRGKGNLPFLIASAKNAKAAKANGQVEKSDEDIKAAKDAASKRRLVTKLVKKADEARFKAISSLSRTRMVKGKVLDFTIQSLVDMADRTTVEAAYTVLNIPKAAHVWTDQDITAWLATNEEENPLRLAFAISLVRGHLPLAGAKTTLQGKDLKFATRTLNYLDNNGGYSPNQAEQFLIGTLDVGEIAPPEPEPKPEKKSAKAKAQEKVAKKGATTTPETLPMAVEPLAPEAPAGHVLCPTCAGTGTNPDDASESCGTCDGSGWVASNEEDPAAE